MLMHDHVIFSSFFCVVTSKREEEMEEKKNINLTDVLPNVNKAERVMQ